MKRLEDIFKEKLDGYGESLPKGSLADFRARLEESRTPVRKKPAVPIVCALVPVLAAAVVAAIVMRMPETGNEVIERNELIESQLLASDEAAEPVSESPVFGQKAFKINRPVIQEAAGEEAGIPEERVAEPEENVSGPVEIRPDPEPVAASGTIEECNVRDTVYSKTSSDRTRSVVGAVTGGVIGATFFGGVLPLLPLGFGAASSTSAPPREVDVLTGTPECYMPLKTGVSFRWKFAGKLSLTTGIEYSMYASRLEYTLSGEHRQFAHYLGVPLRLDYSFVQTERLDVYAGAGAAVDFGIAMTDNGVARAGNGFALSLNGVGGVQFNISPHLGVFIEPQLSLYIPSAISGNITTYRTEHPLSFNVSSGLRVTIGK